MEGWARHSHVTHKGFSACINSSPGPALAANTGHTGAQCSSLCADPCPWLAWQLPLGNGSEGKINISQLYTCPHKLPGKQLGALCSPTHVVHNLKRQEASKPLQGGCLTELCSPALQVVYWDSQAGSLPLWPGRIWAAAEQGLGANQAAQTQPPIPLWDVLRALAGGMTTLGETRHPATLNVSPQSWEMHVSPRGCGTPQGRQQEGDRQQERAGSTALASSPSIGEQRKGFAGIPSPCSKPSRAHSLSACPSAAAAVSHLTFSSLLSRAGSCSPSHGSATASQGKDTKPPPPSPACQPACENSPFWGKAWNSPLRGITAGAQA